MNLSVPNLEDKIDKLISTSKSIVKSISDNLSELKIFEILPKFELWEAYLEIYDILKDIL